LCVHELQTRLGSIRVCIYNLKCIASLQYFPHSLPHSATQRATATKPTIQISNREALVEEIADRYAKYKILVSDKAVQLNTSPGELRAIRKRFDRGDSQEPRRKSQSVEERQLKLEEVCSTEPVSGRVSATSIIPRLKRSNQCCSSN
jgi:hypothetical protein